MKAKLIIFFLTLFLVNQGYSIGFPHGKKKKKTELVDNSKKFSKVDGNVLLIGNLLLYFYQKINLIQK